MPNKELDTQYWQDRLLRFNEEVLKDIEERAGNLIRQYRRIYNENLRDGLSKIYDEYMDKNGEISYTKLLKYNRLKTLNEEIKKAAQELANREIKFFDDNFPELLERVYNESGVMMGVDFNKLDKSVIDKVVNYPWSGKDYKQTVWDNKELLVKNLKQIITQGIIQGKDFNSMTLLLKEAMEKEAWKCRRVVRTETMHMINAGHYERYKAAGVTELEYLATHDYYSSGKPRYCGECMSKDGKKYPIDKAPMVPAHPNCRCTLIPVIETMKDKEDDKKPKSKEAQQQDFIKDVKNKFGVDVSFEDNKDTLHEDFYDTFIKTLDNINKKLPDGWTVDRLVDSINMYSSNNKANIQGGSHYRREIDIVTNFLTSNRWDTYEDLLQGMNSKTYHGLKTMNPLKTLTHEIGHALSFEIYCTKANKTATSAIISANDKLDSAIRKEVLDNLGLKAKGNWSELAYGLSDYATTSASEFFAEAFNEYMDSPTPRPIATEFWNVLLKYLDKYK